MTLVILPRQCALKRFAVKSRRMNFSCHICVSFIAGAVTLRLTLIICHAAQFPQYRFPFFLNHRHYKIIMFLFDHQSQSDVSFLNSLQVQVHQKRTKDQIQGCTEAGDQTQTPILPREDDIVSDTLFCLFQFFSFSSSFLSAARYLSCKSISALSLLYLFFLSFLLSLLSPFSFLLLILCMLIFLSLLFSLTFSFRLSPLMLFLVFLFPLLPCTPYFSFPSFSLCWHTLQLIVSQYLYLLNTEIYN